MNNLLRCACFVIFVISLSIFFFGVLSCEAKALKVVVLTDASGLGDKGFNDVCWQGVQRAKQDFGLSAQFLQSREQADYVSNLTLASRNADVTVTLGFLYADAVKQVVAHLPERRFIHIEGDISGANIASFDFKSEEGGFLAGLVAGLFTKARKVGVVSGMDIPPVEAYVSGFKTGIKTAEHERKESIETIVTSAGSFDDPVKGRSLAQALIGRGVDVIFKAAGNTGVGVIEAVKNSNGTYLIAEDLDQDDEIPGKVLTSALKRMDCAVYEALKQTVEGKFKGGHRWLGAVDGAIDITEMKHSRSLFTAQDLDRIGKARELLKSGKLDVPERYSEVASFEPPNL
ncbi:MAG: BMP family protein [Syntrophobacteraceae bacterium]